MRTKAGMQQWSLRTFLMQAENRRLPSHSISQHNPPDIRDALVLAAALQDVEEIDRITDEAVRTRPDKFVGRHVARAEFAPAERLGGAAE